MTALCFEVQVSLGLSAAELQQLEQRVETWRAEYERALVGEQAARQRADDLGDPRVCGHCIHTPDRLSRLLCGRHTSAHDLLCAATARRIRTQRALADATWALERARGTR